MPSFSSILAFIKKNYQIILLLIAICFIARCSYDAAKASDETKAAQIALSSADSLNKVLASNIKYDTILITDTLAKLDTVWKIRTLVLAKVDSDWMHADSAIALVPASDSACHTAYNGLKAGCELLKTQVKSDSVEMNSLASTLLTTKSSLSSSLSTIGSLQSQINIAKKVTSCKVLFISCPSRTLSFFLGIGIVEAARITLGKP